MKRNNVFQTKSVSFAVTNDVEGELTVLPNDGKSHRLLLSWNDINLKKITMHIPQNASVDLVEIGEPKVSEIHYIVGAYASVHIARATLERVSSSNLTMDIGESAKVVFGVADFAHGKKKEQVTFHLQGRDSHVSWRLSSFADQQDDKAYDVSFIHHAPSTFASMANYGVVADSSRLVFAGISHILNGAVMSKTHQNAKIMVFDSSAQAKANPILKIDDNQVEASHAAAVGKVNDEHLFYLCSRGLSESQAKRVITLGYLNPILDYFSDEDIRQIVADAITKQV